MRLSRKPDRSPYWVFDSTKFDRLTQFAGCWALWSDVFSDPAQALSQYLKRNIVEIGFNVHKNLLAADRLHCTESSYRGRLFVHLLAQSLVMIMYHRLYEMRHEIPSELKENGIDLEGNSLKLLLAKLSLIQAKRVTEDGDSWLVDPLTPKQRIYCGLLKINLPPQTVP